MYLIGNVTYRICIIGNVTEPKKSLTFCSGCGGKNRGKQKNAVLYQHGTVAKCPPWRLFYKGELAQDIRSLKSG